MNPGNPHVDVQKCCTSRYFPKQCLPFKKIVEEDLLRDPQERRNSVLMKRSGMNDDLIPKIKRE